MNALLMKSDLSGGVEIRTDLLSTGPTALSRKRAERVGKPKQRPNQDNKGGARACILCRPEKLVNQPVLEFPCSRRVAAFDNSAPFLPRDQKVMYLWHDEVDVRMGKLHVVQLGKMRRIELFYLLSASIELGKRFPPQASSSFDLLRMIVGFNLGGFAGQTIPHIHIQYGWDVVVGGKSVTQKQLDLYYEELEHEDLILYSDDDVKVIAPWTPKGQYALDLHFMRRYEIRNLSDKDIKLFAHFGWRILQHYARIGIHNVNIVFLNSPLDRVITPVMAQFVPRVNMPALYEIMGVNVVDTPPTAIAEEFRRNINWEEEMSGVEAYDPDSEWQQIVETPRKPAKGAKGKN